MSVAIEVQNLGKCYYIDSINYYKSFREVLQDSLKNIFKPNKSQKKEFWALKNINFTLQKGTSLGIIGKNGAGKSTLLKILSRITPPTEGRVLIQGKVVSLLEVGTGFHPELTGRENIFLNGSILGMTKQEIKSKFNDIVEFSELEEFLDLPIKRYSSGMYVRLAFSVAAYLDPEILIVDEVLAVGDLTFQKKCLGKMNEIYSSKGRTVLFVSHNLNAIKQLCSQCLWLEKGKIVAYGDTSSVIDRYISHISNNTNNLAYKEFEEEPDKDFQILNFKLFNKFNEVTQYFECSDPILLELTCISRRPIYGLYAFLNIYDNEKNTILMADSYDYSPSILEALPKGIYKIVITIPPRHLAPGDYYIAIDFISNHHIKGPYIDSHEALCHFHLEDNSTRLGKARKGYFSSILKWEVSES